MKATLESVNKKCNKTPLSNVLQNDVDPLPKVKKKNFKDHHHLVLDFQLVHLLWLVFELHFEQHASLSLPSYMSEPIWFSLTLKSLKYPKY
jgi:hypothetical protein